MTSLQGKLTHRLTLDALLLASAMMLSYLEVLIPFHLLLPLPAFKPGLANTVVLLAFVLVSKRDAAVISLLRIVLMALLFGSVTSFLFSLAGGILSYLCLLFASRFCKKCSFIGVSVLSAVCHNLGQLLAAVCLFGSEILLSYLPVLLLVSLLSGGLTGLLLNLSVPTLQRSLGK